MGLKTVIVNIIVLPCVCFHFWLPVRLYQANLQNEFLHRAGSGRYQRPPRTEGLQSTQMVGCFPELSFGTLNIVIFKNLPLLPLEI